MAVCLMYHRRKSRRPRYYRVELSYDLFDNISVLCEWGIAGGRGCESKVTFSNLREASVAADRIRNRVQRRGYARLDRSLAVA